MPIHTPLTRLLGIKTPIISAPMAGASGGALAAQVTLGGGFGFLAVGYTSPEDLEKELSTARSLMQSDEQSILPIGVGFLVWQMEKDAAKGEQLLSIALESRVRAIWLAFGEDLGRWVSTIQQLLHSMNELKADVIVIQGNESGGHGLGSSLPLLTLFPLLAAVASTASNGCPPPLVAAGGLANGSHIASLLTLGATGVVLGTRFLLSPESLYSNSQREALLAADSSQSVRTMAFDYVRNTLGWPAGVDGRGLRNATVVDYENGVDIETLRARFTESLREDDSSRMVVWAGSGIGLMNKIMAAREIVDELHEECLRSIRDAGHLIHID